MLQVDIQYQFGNFKYSSHNQSRPQVAKSCKLYKSLTMYSPINIRLHININILNIYEFKTMSAGCTRSQWSAIDRRLSQNPPTLTDQPCYRSLGRYVAVMCVDVMFQVLRPALYGTCRCGAISVPIWASSTHLTFTPRKHA